jgi:hypothetical protein
MDPPETLSGYIFGDGHMNNQPKINAAGEKDLIVVRELTASDMGWFRDAALGSSGKARQCAINFNSAIANAILPQDVLDSRKTIIHATCIRPEAVQEEDRPLNKSGKNWRLGGSAVPGEVFRELKPGDFFIFRLTIGADQPYQAAWTVVIKALDSEKYARLHSHLASELKERMAFFPGSGALFAMFDTLLASVPSAPPPETPPAKPSPPEPKINPIPDRKPRKRTVRERLKETHVLEQLLKLTLSQSSEAQKDYLAVLETLATSIREMLDEGGLIRSVAVDHTKMWSEVAGRPIAFVDGGMANIASLGAEPIAVRVGSYTVTPGRKDPARESFRIEKQLVAELYDLGSGDGLFEDLFEDPAKLREAARYCLELAGGVQCLSQKTKPEFLFLHGALVNPVSAYADKNFPPFSDRGIKALLPEGEQNRTGRDTEFVSVYLRLMQILQNSGANVASVVERASQSTLVSRTLLTQLKNSPVSPGATALEEAISRIINYRITDAVLFHTLLNEGEYVTPIPVDRNTENKRPQHSAHIIANYPLPKVTYLGVGEFAQPLRVEFFDEPPDGYELCLKLVLHACRLMPNYAFPAGLDIVDKFAKVPDWMSRPISSSMSVQLLKRAIDTGNPKIIEGAKRMLCGTKREWLFRPNFNG